MIDANKSLTGIYGPIYVGNSLYQFISNTDKFGPIDPVDHITNMYSAKLMDFLPYVKEGFMLRNSLILLFYVYINNNDLQEQENKQYSHFDTFMSKIFTEMDAEFYPYTLGGKILMSEAIERGIINNSLSTQEIIRLKNPEFNQDDTPIKIKNNEVIYRKAYSSCYFQLFSSHNHYSKNDLIRLNKIEILDAINNEVIQKQMIEEYNILQTTCRKWSDKKL